MNTTATRPSGPSTGRLITAILLFVIVGAPMVYYLWTTLNELLAGHFEGTRFALSVLVLLIFAGLLGILSRSIRRWDERPT
jgi:amino acid permease